MEVGLGIDPGSPETELIGLLFTLVAFIVVLIQAGGSAVGGRQGESGPNVFHTHDRQ